MFVIGSRWPALGKHWRGGRGIKNDCLRGIYMVKIWTWVWQYYFLKCHLSHWLSRTWCESFWTALKIIEALRTCFSIFLVSVFLLCWLCVMLCSSRRKKRVTAGTNYLNYSVTTHTNVPHFHLVPLLNEWVIKKKRKKKKELWCLYSASPFVSVYSHQWISAHMISLIRSQHIWSEKRALQNLAGTIEKTVWYRITHKVPLRT